ncbi:AraC family transcriptional regulator [Kaistia algarum]|uniref:AraC family transcriptional regulator n=1 Tax=Kaistia algarum TaxID=2083279 RepID=UPI000CE8E2D4|nr:AraC family transcriptional regulator [Kaistia algarum]MCX5512392.1 AraC family transcriptional regulator [Kaistia algarum]PPE80472.1 AraC family transcriptional regulator [Kaistia algarum]
MMEPLENLTIHPEDARGAVSGDLLSHVLAQIRLTGEHVASHTLEAAGPLEVGSEDAHVAVVTSGSLRMEEEDTATVTIGAGDLFLFPRGRGGARLVAEEARTTVVVCRFWFDPESLRGMIFALPRCIHIRRADTDGWTDGIAHFLLIETKDIQPGAALMISRLIDLVVIRALRSWVHRERGRGWLGGLSDPRISKALKAIHQEPMRRFSVPVLSDIAGMSRSSFCERFAALVGRSPLRYQNEWRLGLARDMLARRDARVGEIGLRVGYVSEAAFSRAYKDLFGHSPRDEYSPRNGTGPG